MVEINRLSRETRERILRHLRKYRRYLEPNGGEYGNFAIYPFGLSAKGVSKAVHRTTSNTNKHLTDLELEGFLEGRLEHVNGSIRKTKIYLLKLPYYK